MGVTFQHPLIELSVPPLPLRLYVLGVLDTKRTLFWVKLHIDGSEPIKGLLDVFQHAFLAESSLLLLDRLDVLVFVCDISIGLYKDIYIGSHYDAHLLHSSPSEQQVMGRIRPYNNKVEGPCIRISPIVTSKGTSLRGQECSMRSPQGGFSNLLEYLVMSRNHLLPTMRGGCSKPFAAFSVAMIYLGLLDRRAFTEFVEALSIVIWGFVGSNLFRIDPSVGLLHQTLISGWKVCGEEFHKASCLQPMSEIRNALFFMQAQNLQCIICVPGNEGSGTFPIPLLDIMHC
ncbi:hypothetical protein Tco_0833554 [Tanacetum coccineum]